MYKVVLIDQNPEDILHVESSVHWEKNNCAIVAKASNGLDALDLLYKKVPDIIFMGIDLPEMDGLSLLSVLRKEYPRTQITILSEHLDFSYAQRGIELDIARYLIKPGESYELAEALEHMIQRLKILDKAAQEDIKEDGASNNFIVQNAISYMEEHFNEQLTLPLVAEHTYVSQWHLSKMISKTQGKTFNEILNGIRINRAKELLEHTNLQVQEISSRVGFNDATHFARVFKRQTGESANSYRNRVLSEKRKYGHR